MLVVVPASVSLLLLLLLLGGPVFGDEAAPEVKVTQGVLRGKFSISKGGRKFSAFLGIRYAKPPLGNLRFQPPVPGDSWEGVKNATEIHNVCPQRDIYRRTSLIEGDEDCLFLNVYTPMLSEDLKGHRDNDGPLLPVMIFFHGGGFLCGGGNSLWYGPDILLDRDVVLVVTNYRLGALGFLSTGDLVSPGNNGMKDQNLAIKWIKENAKSFGGDPDKITLFGESAGGASVQLHMVSPLSKGLFHAGIAQSGAAQNTWVLAPNDQAVRNGRTLAKLLKCPTANSKKMVECLRKIEPYKLIEQDTFFMDWDTDPMIPFKPVIEPVHDGAFLSEHPTEAIKGGRSAKVPLIVGLNRDDGALRAAGLFANPHLLDELNEDFNKIAPVSLIYDETTSKSALDQITGQIKKFYIGDGKFNKSSKAAVVDMYTDAWFLNGIDEAIRTHMKHVKTPVYYYLFAHRGVASFTSIFGDPVHDYGVCHADELQYLFPILDGLFPDKAHTDADKKVAEILSTLWVNFAKTGKPEADSHLVSEQWQPVRTEDEMEYYLIDADGPRMEKGLFSDRTKFWRRLANIQTGRNEQMRDEL